MNPKSGNLVTILLTGNKKIFKVAKSLLDDASIDFFVKYDGTLDSGKNKDLVEKIDSISFPIEIQVTNEKSSKAKTLLADLEELDFDEKTK